MNVLSLIFGYCVAVLWFYDLRIQKYIKMYLLIDGYRKPYDCFRCTAFWIAQVFLITFFDTWENLVLFTAINYLLSFLIDRR